MQVVTIGCQAPVTATQFLINMTGSTIAGTNTNDVTRIHIYYTGNSAGFAPANEFVSGGIAPATGSITVNGSQALVGGTNYFWIAYDINPSSATAGNLVAAQCTRMTVGGANKIPVVNTSRSRTIAACMAAPGGITNMDFWVKANAGTSTTADGGTLSTWNDQSGNGRNAAATATVNRPTYKDNATDNINFNPVVNFSAAGKSFMPITSNGILSTGNNPYEVYAVLKPGTANLSTPGKFLFAGSGLNGYNAFDIRSSNSYDDSWDVNDLIIGGLWTASYPSLVSFDFNSTLRTIYVSGGSAGIKAGNIHWSTDDFNALGCQYNGASGTNSEYYDGGMAEIITYANASHDQVTRSKVESYLALKYGITLQHNYLNSGGATVWNTNLNTSYDNNIIGIVQDANGGLSQKQSKSTSVVSDMLTMYIGPAKQVNQVNNTGSFAGGDKSFFIAGSNGAPIFFEPGGTTSVPAGICCRLQRAWLSQSTNFTNTDLTLQFDFNDVSPGYGPLLVSDLRLLVDDDGVFSNATVLGSPTVTISVASSVVTVVVPASSITSAKPYFTLGSIAITTPLPVTIKDFSTSCVNKDVQVRWTMGSTGNYTFTIERSSDGSFYSPVGSLTANPSTLQTYSWTDRSSPAGVNTYRLKVTDNNSDAILYSPVVSGAGCLMGNMVVVATDPATHRSSMLILQLAQNAQVDIGFYDLTGHYLEMPGLTGQSNMGQGVYNLPIPQRNLATGIYLLSVKINGIRSIYRIIQ
jgi:hypothetical protein